MAASFSSQSRDSEPAKAGSSMLGRPALKRAAAKIAGAVALLFTALVLLSSCASDHPLDSFQADAGPAAERINNLFYPVLIVAIVVLVLVEGAIIYMARRYRAHRRAAKAGIGAGGQGAGALEDGSADTSADASAAGSAENSSDGGTYNSPAAAAVVGDPYDPDNPGDLSAEPLPEQTHGNLRLEILWTIIPTLILGIISAFTLVAIFDLERVDAEDDSLRVTVVAQQWWWEFQYHLDGDTDSPPDFVTPGEMVIPVGQQVPLQITSRDVIHSFWIPQLNGKKDGVPGSYHDWIIEASRPGRYLGACTEFCGLSHGYMRMYTIALDAAEWDAWAANQIRPAPLLSPGDEGYEGQQLFVDNCARCHSIAGVTDTNADGQTDQIGSDTSIYSGGDPVHDQLVAGAAPDMTHLASRATFAGATYDLYEDRGEDIPYTQLAQQGELNAVDLERWISNAPARKPAMWEQARGMPPFPNLAPEDIDSLVAYLQTLT